MTPEKSLEERVAERPTDQALQLLAVEVTGIGQLVKAFMIEIVEAQGKTDKWTGWVKERLNKIEDNLSSRPLKDILAEDIE